jgi:phage FluMu gp28-like protein
MTLPLLLPYQKKWINDSAPIKLMEKSRQIGISWATAYSVIRRHLSKDNTLDTFISTRDHYLSRLFLKDCQSFAQLIDSFLKQKGRPILCKKQASKCTLNFTNGTRIHALSSSPNAQAGKRGTRILDEFALHADPESLYTIAYPGTTWGGQQIIISTHRGKHNYFNQLIQEILHNGNPKQISHHRVTLEDALDQGFLKLLKAKIPKDDPRQDMNESSYFDYIRQSCSSHEAFLQEYMCQPEDSASAFLPYELILQNEYPPSINWEEPLPLRNDADFYLGIDIGRTQDYTVFYLIQKEASLYLTRKIISLKDQPFSKQARLLHDLLLYPSLRRVCIDQSGLGRQFAESFKEQYSKGRIEGITFTNSTKETLAYALRSSMESHSFRIPSLAYLRADFNRIQKITTLSGNTRLDTPPSKDGHSDHFWAAALALHAAQNQKNISSTHYSSLKRPSSTFYF